MLRKRHAVIGQPLLSDAFTADIPPGYVIGRCSYLHPGVVASGLCSLRPKEKAAQAEGSLLPF